MKSLVLVAHGSRRESSNDEVREVAARLAQRTSDTFANVSAAFLELAEPSIADGIVSSVDAGASEIVVLPYFLSAGRHVVTDIPREVDAARAARPNADICVVPYLGASHSLLDVLASLATDR